MRPATSDSVKGSRMLAVAGTVPRAGLEAHILGTAGDQLQEPLLQPGEERVLPDDANQRRWAVPSPKKPRREIAVASAERMGVSPISNALKLVGIPTSPAAPSRPSASFKLSPGTQCARYRGTVFCSSPVNRSSILTSRPIHSGSPSPLLGSALSR